MRDSSEDSLTRTVIVIIRICSLLSAGKRILSSVGYLDIRGLEHCDINQKSGFRSMCLFIKCSASSGADVFDACTSHASYWTENTVINCSTTSSSFFVVDAKSVDVLKLDESVTPEPAPQLPEEKTDEQREKEEKERKEREERKRRERTEGKRGARTKGERGERGERKERERRKRTKRERRT